MVTVIANLTACLNFHPQTGDQSSVVREQIFIHPSVDIPLMTSTAYKSQEIATREPQRKPRRKTKPRGIVPSDFSCDLSNQRINYIFDELKKLPVAQYPNATAILLRGLLEMSLSYYLNRTGHLDKMIEAAKKKAEKKGQTFPKTFNPTPATHGRCRAARRCRCHRRTGRTPCEPETPPGRSRCNRTPQVRHAAVPSTPRLRR